MNKAFILISSILLGIYTILPNTVHAKTSDGISLSPSFTELTAQPGDIQEIEFTLKNHNEAPVETKINFRAGIIDSQNFKLQPTDTDTMNSASWLSLIEELPVTNTEDNNEENESQKNVSNKLIIEESETIRFKLQIPKDIPSGTYYPLVEFTFKTAEGSAQVGLSYKLISALYLTIYNPNDTGITHELQLEQFKLRNTLTLGAKNTIDIQILNSGNVYTKPIGYIEIFDAKGVRQLNTLQINEDYSVLYPEQTLLQEFNWTDATITNQFFPPIGRYTTQLNIRTDQETEYTQYEESFIVIPKQYLVYLVITGISIAAIRNIIKLIVSKKNGNQS